MNTNKEVFKTMHASPLPKPKHTGKQENKNIQYRCRCGCCVVFFASKEYNDCKFSPCKGHRKHKTPAQLSRRIKILKLAEKHLQKVLRGIRTNVRPIEIGGRIDTSSLCASDSREDPGLNRSSPGHDSTSVR